MKDSEHVAKTMTQLIEKLVDKEVQSSVAGLKAKNAKLLDEVKVFKGLVAKFTGSPVGHMLHVLIHNGVDVSNLDIKSFEEAYNYEMTFKNQSVTKDGNIQVYDGKGFLRVRTPNPTD